MSLKKTNKIAETVSAELLAEVVAYDPLQGSFTWLFRPERHFQSAADAARWNGKYAGKPAFTSACPRGYYRGCINGKFLYAHRAALALSGGTWPDGEVDHINRDKSDNRLANLRPVTHAENRTNTESCDGDLVGIRRGKSGQYVVSLKIDGRNKYLGTFGSLADAVGARDFARASK